MTTQGQLSAIDHDHLGAFLDTVLRRHAAGEMSAGVAKNVLLTVMSALDRGDLHEVRRWIEEGRAATATR
jgi:hypothetical protein